MLPSRRILKEWLSESAQVVLMAASEGHSMRREACPDDQYWLMLRGAWTNRSPSGRSTLQCAEGAHFRPATPCVRRALTDTLSLGVRLFHDAPIRQEGLARPSGFEGVLWPLAHAMLSGACPREDALDEAILPLLGGRPSEGEAHPPRWLARVRDRLDAETAPTSLAELAAAVEVSSNHLCATFTRHYGRPISRYRHELGLRRALRSLALPAGAPGEAALCGGFYDQAHFTRICRRDLGLTPGQVACLLPRGFGVRSYKTRRRADGHAERMMVHPLMVALFLHDPADDVRARLQTYVEATRTYDAKTLDSLLHPAYVEVSPLGELDERGRVLSFYRLPEGQAPPMPERIAIDDLAVRFPSRDVAVAVFRETATVGGGLRAFRATAVLKRERSIWLLFSLSAVAIRPSARPSP